ncbi:endopeptidase La [Desulfosarcina ovata]|uniref:endopeptidase La n=1 Tax=Desulfosarcina ovata subsp. ovata TaxID=2752305 RepID=A0A5K8AKL8_9BACT|nr:endopeptidase La [Desulfosarcina ovata]BBO93241.1 endopeptidase La [Desulfosarcina ovata subsp. ovata]
MRFFKKESPLPEQAPPSTEMDQLRQLVRKAGMPPEAADATFMEIDRIAKMPPGSTEHTIGVSYIDYLTHLPWNRTTDDRLDLKAAKQVLDDQHEGLLEIKNRVLEHLAVRILRSERRHTMLVVDDEKTTRMNLMHVLTKEGYAVETAADGLEAIRLLEKQAFDIVITDLKMEQADGMQVLETAKQKNPDTEVIIITGYATVATAVSAMQKGSYHFLAKPLKLDEIRTTVAKALRPKQTRLDHRGPVLCFVGPPGTGKTSLGLAIAKSMQRRFVRISLAGMKDEAQLRGHRRSYVGALPGRIIQEIRRVETINPVFMLDELDKISQEFKGDPAAVLLEVLDPQQNTHFMDNYLDLPFDLSKVMFIATANTVDTIPEALLDRLEVIELSGYTEQEKVRIAFNHLIPREIETSGLEGRSIDISQAAVVRIIREYTREAGLRGLQRQIAGLCRKIALDQVDQGNDAAPLAITEEAVERLLGPRRHTLEVTQARDRVGVATGLAWTRTGGEIVFVEATQMRGAGQLTLTGSLGTVMRESAQAAMSYIRSHVEAFGIPADFFERHDIHIHIPAGAIPKDGTSAGVPIAAALLSMITGRACRRDTAMTGELTLTGRILPVGGIREKLLAAHRAGVRTVVLPAKNGVDLQSIPDEIKQVLCIIPIEELPGAIEQVLIGRDSLN